MKIETHQCGSLTKRGNITPSKVIKDRMERTDLVLKFFHKLKPEELSMYVSHFKDKLHEIIGDYKFDINAFDWDFLREGMEMIQNFQDLEKAVFLWICKTLKLPNNYNSEQGEIELMYFDWIKSGERLSYHRVKTFVELYGEEIGTEIYKQIIPDIIKELKSRYKREQPDDPKSQTILVSNKRSIESWCRIGLVDFAFCIFDDHKIVYRFDSCLTPEALKDFNDPDVAYLASCYIGDAPEWNKDKIIHMRRTQTLHHEDFCDEMYWNNFVHPNAEQPSLEFTKNIGKKDE
ncbi:MAG: hypothetical protein H7645_11790 [Candidatus Heimdallarchaeota archaeon]|nr:hypothetical protein [Candidatus Heimdallarchaeota archaeon]MCK4771004.1 hypothetical protein [Candidatus Heimdallarchaeota archaeon]